MILDINSEGFVITNEEVIEAIINTNPNKAIGCDNISLKPLDRKECLWIQYEERNYIEPSGLRP